MELFESDPSGSPSNRKPLAERVRPRSLDEFVGQEHLLGKGGPLRTLIDQGRVPTMLLWGPPGTGKTTLARIIAGHTDTTFHQLNAVSSGVKEVRSIIEYASRMPGHSSKPTILFIDEIHRFNKAQQDALLHSVEEGILTLIGATTENPSFEVIAPLLSRSRLYVLQPLADQHLLTIINRALEVDTDLQNKKIVIRNVEKLIALSGGDARMLLNGLETAVSLAKEDGDHSLIIGDEEIEAAFQRRMVRYDKGGEEHYNCISAFIKSVRGCDPDATVYWMARMLDAGEDPKFIARRMIILASEDIGNADPDALTMAVSCFSAVDFIGMPEARIVLAQTATYLSSAPKSNAAYRAIEGAMKDVRELPDDPVPVHLRNAPTRMMKEIGYGAGYLYGHEFDGHFTEQQYLPDNLASRIYYNPSGEGEEINIGERLRMWWKGKKRYR